MRKLNILITGHTNGIGKSLFKYLSKEHNVTGIARTNDKKNKERQFKCDVSNYNALKKVFAKIKKIDVLINNAGISKYSNNDVKNFDKIVKINLNGVYYCSKLGIKKLKNSSSPRIINISSINAYQAFPNNPGYIASKGGVLSLTRSLALDCQKNEINVNSISPGYFKTKMTSKSYNNKIENEKRKKRTILKRWGNPDDLFGLIKFLISENSSYITGQDFVVDGGWLAKGL